MMLATSSTEAREERGAIIDQGAETESQDGNWVVFDVHGTASTVREFGCIDLDIMEIPEPPSRMSFLFSSSKGGTRTRTVIAVRHPEEPTKRLTLLYSSCNVEAMEQRADCVREVLETWEASRGNRLTIYKTLEDDVDLRQQLLVSAETLLEERREQEKAVKSAAESDHAVEVSTLREFGCITLDVADQKSQPLGIFSRLWRRQTTTRTFRIVFRHPQQRDSTRSLILYSSGAPQNEMEKKAQSVRAVLDEWDQTAEALGARFEALEKDESLRWQLLSSAEEKERAAKAAAEQFACRDECPICFEPIEPNIAAMSCRGLGGKRHYFHAACLQRWVQSSHGARRSCPVCRGPVQDNAGMLNAYLQAHASDDLSSEARSVLREIADGLSHCNSFVRMSNIERTAYASGMLVACGTGAAIGYGVHDHILIAYNRLALALLSREQLMMYRLGYVAGVAVRFVRMMREMKVYKSCTRPTSSSRSSRRPLR